MALGQIPPWLDVNPAQFTQAAEGGAHLGLELGQQQQQVVQEQAARQQQAQQVAAQRAQQQQEFAANQQLDQERLAAQQAEAQQRLQLETQTAARKFQAQQMYQQALKSGQDPIQAMLQYGPQMGESMSGLGPLSLSETRMKQASVPPQPVNGPDGQPVGYTYGGNMHMLPRKQATLPQKLSDADKLLAEHYISELKDIAKETTANAAMPDAATARSLRNRKDDAEARLKDLGLNIDGDQDQQTPPGQGQPAGPPKVGDVQDGYKFLGGNPGDQQNWQPASNQ